MPSPTASEYDIDVARTNIIGELMDLQASGVIREDFDCIEVGDTLVERLPHCGAGSPKHNLRLEQEVEDC